MTLTETTAPVDPNPTRFLQCMEVWGGNQAVSTSIILPGLDAWIYSRPHHGADGGGDVHYASSCAAGALSRMLVADVAGHGDEASDMARRLRKLMQRHIVQHEQTRFVRSMNREFATITRDGRFATAVAFSYDAPINRLQICNAGHPPPLIRRQGESSWSPLEAAARQNFNLPLGIEDIDDYKQFDVSIRPGDLVLCYTDGLLECRRNETMLGQNGLIELLGGLNIGSPQNLGQGLIDSVTERGWTIADDLTILMFSPNGTRSSIPMRDRLLAPFRFVRAIVRGYAP